jgi:hypothetical protein
MVLFYFVVGILMGIAGAVSQFDSTLVIAAIVAYFLLGWLYYGLGENLLRLVGLLVKE